ncbi:hypothetical protein BY458DRAFT_353253 [Sporodiniella umbellata]|nr:hypothetical protein BY458DRAFT_353253 [Sporodiniella umbellata]
MPSFLFLFLFLPSLCMSNLELATDIGRGLLGEINRMRSVLEEKDEALDRMEHQQREKEHKVHALYHLLAHKTEKEQQQQKEIANLERAQQTMTLHVSELQQHLSQLRSEHTLLQHQSSRLQDELTLIKKGALPERGPPDGPMVAAGEPFGDEYCLLHTMKGEPLKKYVRNPLKAKFGSFHTRFFRLDPYTKTLYWTKGSSKLKSLTIQSFSILPSHHHSIPILCIRSLHHQMKILCQQPESFQKWSQVRPLDMNNLPSLSILSLSLSL